MLIALNCLVQDSTTHSIIRELHQFIYELFLLRFVGLGGYHVANSFIKGVHLKENMSVNLNRQWTRRTCCGDRSTVIRCNDRRMSSTKGSDSPLCCMTKCFLHFCAILMNVSQAISWTPTYGMRQQSIDFDAIQTFMCFVHEFE